MRIHTKEAAALKSGCTKREPLGPNDLGEVTAAIPAPKLESRCRRSRVLRHNSAHKRINHGLMQARANDMQALASSSGSAIAGGKGGDSP